MPRFPFNTALQVVGITILFASSASRAQSHDCDAILEQGIRNTYQQLRTGDFRSAFASAYCNKTSASTGSSSGSDFGGSYGGFGLDFGSSSSNISQARAEICGQVSSAMSDAQLLKAMQSVADPNIVDAWSACKRSAYGVMINGELNGNDLVITYVFRAAGSIAQAKVDGAPYITGAKCNDAVRNGTIINTGGRIQSCTRDGDGPVSIAINTDFQSARFFIPAVVKPKSRPTTYANGPFAGQPIVQIDKKRMLPGVGIAPEGYTWCVLDPKGRSDPNVQSYCFAKEQSGWCHCAVVPPGYPQPSTDPRVAWGYVYEGQ